HKLGIFSAGQPGMQAAVEPPPTDMELQGFWDVLKKIGKGAQTGLDIGHKLGIFNAGPQPQAAAEPPPTDMELQNFWNVLKKISKTTQTGLDIGHKLGVFNAGQTGTTMH
ncbi:hypothetical protein ACQR1Q_10675, partial [Bradyrhizobium oligotrophicum]